jgi:SAM-dependent methyltransferase
MEGSQAYRRVGAEAFRQPEVTAAYDARPGYPSEAIQYIVDHALPVVSFDGRPLPRMLDAGAGNGLVTEGIMRNGAAVEIIALDQSEGMAAAFQRKIIEPSAPMIIGTFDAMPFRDNTFDLIVFGSALHWGDPTRLPAELYRILCPGGRVVSVGNATRPQSEFTEILAGLPGQAFQANPMTCDREKINLGPGFTFECFKGFPNDLIYSVMCGIKCRTMLNVTLLWNRYLYRSIR